MATTTTPNVRLSSLQPAAGRAGLRGAIASEFTKIRSVRSTYWTLAVLLVISIGIGAAISAGAASQIHGDPTQKVGFDATQVSLFAFFELGQLIIAVIGAMAITSEYSTGMIRTSLTALPRRGVVYAAKAIVLAGVTLVVSLVTSFIAFFVGQAILSGTGVSASLFGSVTVPTGTVQVQPGGAGKAVFGSSTLVSSGTVLGAIIGTALFVTVVAVIAFGLGAIIRHTAGAITTVIGMMFVIPIIVQILPSNWRWDLMRFMPDSAGRVISVTISGHNGDNLLHLWSAWPQFLVTVVYAVALLGIGAYLFRKRDA
jgi:ABC-type transport system involved in multi-copper enzyme maturation permease subunit